MAQRQSPQAATIVQIGIEQRADLLLAALAGRPGITLAVAGEVARCAWRELRHDDDLALFQASQDHGQQKSAQSVEQKRPVIVKKRHTRLETQAACDPEKLVVDESWASTNMAHRYPIGDCIDLFTQHECTSYFAAGGHASL